MFDSIWHKFQLRLRDRVSAANLLAEVLRDFLKKEKAGAPEGEETDGQNTLVLGIPRGGVIIADIVCSKISARAHFDIIIARKLTSPYNPELAIGAVMEDGSVYFNEHLIKQLGIPQDYIEREKSKQIEEISRRAALYRNASQNHNNIKNGVVIIVDDGAATGSTLTCAARSIKKQMPGSLLIIGLPVASKEAIELLKKEADLVEVVIAPSNFRSVGQYYQHFEPVSDNAVKEIMRKRRLLP